MLLLKISLWYIPNNQQTDEIIPLYHRSEKLCPISNVLGFPQKANKEKPIKKNSSLGVLDSTLYDKVCQ